MDPAIRRFGMRDRSNCATKRLLEIRGKRTVDSFHRELGKMMWDNCGMSRNAAGLEARSAKIPELREQYWQNVEIPGSGDELNQSLEKAGRVADFLELAELMCLDALRPQRICGGHFREEHQTADGEAQRNDDLYSYVAAWEYAGAGRDPILHKEPLDVRIRPSQPAELQIDETDPSQCGGRGIAACQGKMVRYEVNDVNPDMSILECSMCSTKT